MTNPEPRTDPTNLLRLRDSIYAADLFIAAAGWLDLFTWLSDNPADLKTICSTFDIKQRPTDVMLTLFTAMGLTTKAQDKYELTETAKEYLCQ